jgi:hypothetical protein
MEPGRLKSEFVNKKQQQICDKTSDFWFYTEQA